MSLATLQFFSNAIRKQFAMNVILPDSGKGPFPVYYLLHGLSDDHTIWCRRTSIERYVADMPLIVVMPDGGRGWYTDAKEGFAYEKYMLEDVIGTVERIFPARKGNKRARVIGGLSMGGYGALKLCFKYPEMFAGVAAHSSALYPPHDGPRGDHKVELTRVFGAKPNPEEDVFVLAKKNRKKLPPVRFDCGTEDGLISGNRDLHALLNKLGVKHEYEEFPGSHNWAYWDVHVQEALKFLSSSLGLA